MRPDGAIVTASGSAAEIFSRPAPELAGASLPELAGDPAAVRSHLSAAATTLHPLPGALTVRGDGATRYRTWSARWSADDPERTILMRIRRPDAADNFAVLTERVVGLNQEILRRKAAQEELEAALRLRDEFVAVASHELRNPINAMHLQLTALERGVARAAPPEWIRERLARASGQLDRLVRLVDGLLGAALATEGTLPREDEPVDLVELASEIAEQWRVREGGEIEVESDGPVRGTWDRLRLEQVIGNIVSNAVKYGRGNPVTIAVRNVGDAAEVAVVDRGIGIAPESVDHIFERFRRGVSRRHFGGFGLGLWVARRIAGELGGKISVESRLGEGSTFTVTLPRGDAGGAA